MSIAKKYDLKFPRNCKLCGKTIKSKSGLGSHLKNQHSIKYEEYLKKYYSIDLDKQITEWVAGKAKRVKEGHIKTGLKNKGKSPSSRLTKEQYKNWRSSMSKVFTLNWFIEKYGKDDGLQLHKKRSEEISKTSFFREYNKINKANYSKISQKLFWDLFNSTNFKEVYFGELNHEYSCGNNINYDFVVVDTKCVIEFNGNMWHANPILYEASDTPNPFDKQLTAEMIWKKDKKKLDFLINNLWKVMVIWENEYEKYPKETFEHSLKFIQRGI